MEEITSSRIFRFISSGSSFGARPSIRNIAALSPKLAGAAPCSPPATALHAPELSQTLLPVPPLVSVLRREPERDNPHPTGVYLKLGDLQGAAAVLNLGVLVDCFLICTNYKVVL